MAITVDWNTLVITIPQSYLTFISGTLYELDTDQFRLDLHAIEAGPIGIAFPDAHQHTTQYTIAGVTYARAIAIINGYTITFEDGQYAVRLAGSNNDLFDEGILNRNQVSVIPTNSAGLILGGGSSPTAADIADAVWSRNLSTYTVADTAGLILNRTYSIVRALLGMSV